MPYLGYRNSLEKLAERFHTTPEVLAKRNTPNMTARAVVILRVPQVPDQADSISADDVTWSCTPVTLRVSARQPPAEHLPASSETRRGGPACVGPGSTRWCPAY